MSGGADISDCGTYRYRLWRYWSHDPEVVWVMLNPSTADDATDDPTIRKCMGFTRYWSQLDTMPNFGGIIVVNLYALRATDPSELLRHPDPVGPLNDEYVFDALRSAAYIVTAWGAKKSNALKSHKEREDRIFQMAASAATAPMCHLGRTRHGHPRHPLYLPYSSQLQEW